MYYVDFPVKDEYHELKKFFHSVACVIDNRDEIIQLDGIPTLNHEHPHDKVSRNSVCCVSK